MRVEPRWIKEWNSFFFFFSKNRKQSMHAVFIDQPPSLPPLEALGQQEHSGISIFNKHPERLWSRKSQGLTSTTLGILASQAPILNKSWQRVRCSCYLPLDKELKQGAFQKKEQKRKLVKNINLHDPPQSVPASYLLLLDVSISVSISGVQCHCDGRRGQGGPVFSNSHEWFSQKHE